MIVAESARSVPCWANDEAINIIPYARGRCRVMYYFVFVVLTAHV